jgi:hypothetical protein
MRNVAAFAAFLLLSGCADPVLNNLVVGMGVGAGAGAMMGAVFGGVGAGPGALAGAAMGLSATAAGLALGTPLSPLYPVPPVAMVPSYYPQFPRP